MHTLKAFLDAESYPGVSIIIAYSPCIAHGVDMSFNLRQQDLAVKSGHWPLLRYDPRLRAQGRNPLWVVSAAPSVPYRDFARNEARVTVLERQNPRPRPASSTRPSATPAVATTSTPSWPRCRASTTPRPQLPRKEDAAPHAAARTGDTQNG